MVAAMQQHAKEHRPSTKANKVYNCLGYCYLTARPLGPAYDSGAPSALDKRPVSTSELNVLAFITGCRSPILSVDGHQFNVIATVIDALQMYNITGDYMIHEIVVSLLKNGNARKYRLSVTTRMRQLNCRFLQRAAEDKI